MAYNQRWFKVFELLFPRANAFSLFIQKKFTKLIEGLTALPHDFRNYIDQIWLDIFPSSTRSIELWEKQWGIINPAADNATRRIDLDILWKLTGGQGKDYIETTLRNAGFDVYVHENNPPVDPDNFLSGVFVMVAGGVNAYAGRSDAYAGKTGSELLVNGPIVTNTPLVLAVAGRPNSCAGNQFAVASYFEQLMTYDRIYQITDDPDLWPYFFFVGGPAVRGDAENIIMSDSENVIMSDGTNVVNSESPALVSIDYAQIPAERENDFKALLLKLKPAQSWAGLIINFT